MLWSGLAAKSYEISPETSYMIRATLIALTLFIAGTSLSSPAFAQSATSDIPQPEQELTHLLSEAPDDHVLGDPDAPHTLIAYASNMCPHCGHWFTQDWPTIKRDLVETGKVRFVFRPFPTQPVQLSLTGFLMAECAPEEDYISVMEDQFARQSAILSAATNQDGETLRTEFDAIAQKAGLNDPTAVTNCLENDAHFAALELQSRRAQATDIRGVPAFIFDGQVMRGANNAAAIQGWVEGRSSQP